MSNKNEVAGKGEVAGKVAGTLVPAERAMNSAFATLCTVGLALTEARNSPHFHPLDGQRAFELVGASMAKMVEATGAIARAHDEMVKVAVAKEIMEDTFPLCPAPSTGVHANQGAIVLPIAA